MFDVLDSRPLLGELPILYHLLLLHHHHNLLIKAGKTVETRPIWLVA